MAHRNCLNRRQHSALIPRSTIDPLIFLNPACTRKLRSYIASLGFRMPPAKERPQRSRWLGRKVHCIHISIMDYFRVA